MNVPSPAPPSRVPWPPLFFFASLAIGIGLHLLWPIPLWRGQRLWMAGVVLVAFAAGISWWAHHVLARAHTTIRPDRASTALVTAGPFGLTRNPLYVALVAISLGVALILNGLFPLLMAVCLWLGLNLIVIPNEERHLRERFPDEYAHYCRRVRRWV